MRFDLDVALIEWPGGRVLALEEGVARRRFVGRARGGAGVAALELPAGMARSAGISAGEILRSGAYGARERPRIPAA